MWEERNYLEEIVHMTHESACLAVQDLPFRRYVVDACKANACGRYGKTWKCPPAVGDFESLQKDCLVYAKALVFSTVHVLEDSFDIEGMEAGRQAHEQRTDKVAQLFVGKNIKVLSAGGCGLCKRCTYPDAPCRFPSRARSSVESHGISVVELAKQCGLHYKNQPDTVTYFSIILYNDID